MADLKKLLSWQVDPEQDEYKAISALEYRLVGDASGYKAPRLRDPDIVKALVAMPLTEVYEIIDHLNDVLYNQQESNNEKAMDETQVAMHVYEDVREIKRKLQGVPGPKKSLSWQIEEPKLRTFEVKVELYGRELGEDLDDKHFTVSAYSIGHLFYKIKSQCTIEYYLPTEYFDDMTEEEMLEYKAMSDEELLNTLESSNGDGGDWITIYETSSGEKKLIAGGDGNSGGPTDLDDADDDGWRLINNR